ncbi:MAG: haloalkane dehalogenase [Myxococcota bacterium]|jgi:haloalkane dehalogenase
MSTGSTPPTTAPTAKAALTPRPDAAPISAAFPFESQFADVLDSKMHYIDVGEGDPIIFLHGNPASSYLWRNIIGHLQPNYRCIAVDLIGMGQSDRPNIEYTYDDHSRYLSAFIDSLGLDNNITLVIHDWGSMLGFRWASENTDRVKGIAFMEAMVRPLTYADLPGSLKVAMRLMRNPFFNWLLVGVGNIFLKFMLPDLTYRKMSPDVLGNYQKDYPTVASRVAVRKFPREVPFNGYPVRSYDIVTGYVDWIASTEVPMLLLHGDDGVAIKAAEVDWLRETVTTLEIVNLGHGKHFLPETHPHRIGAEIARWRTDI